MAKAIAKYIRMSPRKLRRVVNEIRGKDASSAQVILKFMPYAGARVVEKVLKSAIANAKENEKLNLDQLKVSKACVDQSVTMRRWRAMSRGRGYLILKRMSHVTLEVIEGEGKKLIKKSAFKRATSAPKHEHVSKPAEETHVEEPKQVEDKQEKPKEKSKVERKPRKKKITEEGKKNDKKEKEE